MAHEDLAARGGHDAARVPLEEPHLQGLFDLPQQLGGGRLCHADGPGRAHDTALLVQVGQESDLPHFQARTDQRTGSRAHRHNPPSPSSD